MREMLSLYNQAMLLTLTYVLSWFSYISLVSLYTYEHMQNYVYLIDMKAPI